MGFNNGYDSGYEDAKAEFAAEKAALEKRIKELEASGGGSSGSGGSSQNPAGGGQPSVLPPHILLSDLNYAMRQLVADPNDADADLTAAGIIIDDSLTDVGDRLVYSPGGTPLVVVPKAISGTIESAMSSMGMTAGTLPPGIYYVTLAQEFSKVADLSAIKNL